MSSSAAPACDELLSKEGLLPRVTKDIDTVIVVEKLSSAFIAALWDFLRAGRYESLQAEKTERKYYRFTKPLVHDYPHQIELFSRVPDAITGPYASHLVHLDLDDAISSVSAILMNDDYYAYTIEHSSIAESIRWADLDALICLKAKAFLDLTERLARGERVDKNEIKKHKNDVFRLSAIIPAGSSYDLPGEIKKDLTIFLGRISDELPDSGIFDKLGARGVVSRDLHALLQRAFKITEPHE